MFHRTRWARRQGARVRTAAPGSTGFFERWTIEESLDSHALPSLSAARGLSGETLPRRRSALFISPYSTVPEPSASIQSKSSLTVSRGTCGVRGLGLGLGLGLG